MPADSSAGRPSVLVVDDDSASASAVARALQDDYDVSIACDGVEGLEKARYLRPDLVLADVMMPRLDGFHMVRELRDTIDPPPAVIFLTARDTPLDAVQGVLVGATRYLGKPVSLDVLLEEVRDALRSRSPRTA